MEILVNRIQYLCKINNVSLNRLESLTCLSKGSISKWSKSIPSADKIQKVADYFDVSIDYLMGRTENFNSHKNGVMVDMVGVLGIIHDAKSAIENVKAVIDGTNDNVAEILEHAERICMPKD